MIVALTGVPGTGKTAVARILRRRGVRVVDLKRFAARRGLLGPRDRARRSRVVDPARVGRALARELPPGGLVVIEGHVAHLLPGLDACIVLRTRPRVLERRLAKRGWPRAKVRENAEAEAVDVIALEAAALPLAAEIDTTRRTAASTASLVVAMLRGGPGAFKSRKPGSVDWSSDVLAWY